MPNLGGLTSEELDHVVIAADLLLAFHKRYEILDRELAIKLDTFRADALAAQEDARKRM